MAGKTAAEKAAEAAAGKAAGTGEARVGEVHGSGTATVAVVGTTDAAVAGGEALATAAPGGPGIGAAQVATLMDGPSVGHAPIADAARPAHLGDRMGTFPRPGEFRAAEGLEFERAPAVGGLIRGDGALAERLGTAQGVVIGGPAATVRRAGRDDILPLGAPQVDPATVPGTKIATAAAQVRRDRRSYVPGEPFPIDFRAYTELVPIGAIVATPWDDLPDHEG